jgi:hypothetical protein
MMMQNLSAQTAAREFDLLKEFTAALRPRGVQRGRDTGYRGTSYTPSVKAEDRVRGFIQDVAAGVAVPAAKAGNRAANSVAAVPRGRSSSQQPAVSSPRCASDRASSPAPAVDRRRISNQQTAANVARQPREPVAQILGPAPQVERARSGAVASPLRSLHSRAKSLHPVSVLSISDYERLRASLDLLLRRESFRTESVDSSAYFDVFQVRSFQLAIVCQSVPRQRADRIAELLRRYNPHIRIVRVTNSDPAYALSFDRVVESLRGSEYLLRVIREIADTFCATDRVA